MKFKLSLNTEGQGNLLPLNYQYEVSSWIYSTIKKGNKEFACWLHEKGYENGKKTFKLFTFSKLYPENYRIVSDRMELLSPNVGLNISFFMDQAAEPFIVGMFTQQQFFIGDKKSKVGFRVNTIEKTADPKWGTEMRFQCESPLVVSIKEEGGSGHARYIGPDDEQYEYYFTQNLISKYVALLSSTPGLSGITDISETNQLRFGLIGQAKSKLVTIKQGKPEESKIRGYLFRFKIRAPEELIKIGYFAGFGEKNSLGFGSVKELVP
jgi:CRISPR-associated endoribonuclease Cas6